MDKRDKSRDRFSSETSNILHSEHHFSFSLFFEQVHSDKALHLIAGLLLIILSSCVITVSILGYIQELWISNVLTMISSISTVIGCYLVYNTVSKWRDSGALLRDAMKRVMESKN